MQVGRWARVNQIKSSKSKEPHTGTREATSQHHHTGSKPCVAKRRRLGGLKANRASVSLRDSLNTSEQYKHTVPRLIVVGGLS